MVGIVTEVGVGVSSLKVGDRVVVFDSVSCGFCEKCVVGQRAYCLTINPPFEGDFFGINIGGREINGGQAQFVLVPFAEQSTLTLPPGDLHELDYLLLADIWPTAWECLDRSEFEAGDSVVVFGAGKGHPMRNN